MKIQGPNCSCTRNRLRDATAGGLGLRFGHMLGGMGSIIPTRLDQVWTDFCVGASLLCRVEVFFKTETLADAPFRTYSSRCRAADLTVDTANLIKFQDIPIPRGLHGAIPCSKQPRFRVLAITHIRGFVITLSCNLKLQVIVVRLLMLCA